jgi:hypothetical protein
MSLDAKLKDSVRTMVNRAGESVVGDIVRILDEQSEIENPEQVGSGLTFTLPLTEATVALKAQSGSATPEVPRVRSGAMRSAIQMAESGELSVTVTPGGEAAKAQAQQDGIPGNTFNGKPAPVPPRPFFGVTSRALEVVKRDCEQQLQQFVQSANATLRFEVNIA